MSETVNVLALVCAEDVLAKYGPNQGQGDPVVLDEDCGGLIVAGAYGGGKAIFDLAVNAPPGTQENPTYVRWRTCTLSMNAAYRCSIEKIAFNAGIECMRTPAISSVAAEIYMTDLEAPKDASKLVAQSVTDEYWESQVAGSGSAPYLIDLKISDEKGTVQGYYRIGSAAAGQPSVNIAR